MVFARAKNDHIAKLQASGRFGKSFPGGPPQFFMKIDADGGDIAIARARASERRRYDLGVVEHQHITLAQDFQHVRILRPVRQIWRLSGKHLKQARGITRLSRTQGDGALRQLEIEII